MKKWIDFGVYSSLKIGGEIQVEVLDEPCVFEGTLIGRANNLLISPEAKNLFVLGKNFDYIVDLGECIEIGGATRSGTIYQYFKKHDLRGLEFLRGLPGSLGGLIQMNAGMKEYEIAPLLQSVCIDGEWILRENIPFAYRFSGIKGGIYGARFEKKSGFREELVSLFEKMRRTHPHLPSCGSCFKNPVGDYAGRLLESVGLRGFKIGDAGFSQEHSNFLVNYGNATFQDAVSLIALAKKRVFESFGVDLECEVRILDGI